MSGAASASLPPLLVGNPRLAQWVEFDRARAGQSFDRSGRVRPGRVDCDAADRRRGTRCRPRTHRAAIGRHRADAQRRLHRGQPVDPIRRRRVTPGLRRGEEPVSRPRRRGLRLFAARSVGGRRYDHPSWRKRPGTTTGRSLQPSILTAMRNGGTPTKTPDGYRVVGRYARARRPRGQGVWRAGVSSRHGAGRHAACPRRAAAAPRRHDQVGRRGGDAPRRQRTGRHCPRGNFLAVTGADETAVDAAAAAAPTMSCGTVSSAQPVAGRGALAFAAALHRPACRRPVTFRRGDGGEPLRGDLYTHACRARLGGAVLRACRLSRRAARGVDAFAGRLSAARRTRPDVEARSGDDPVNHAQGPGCYGHNGADDAAADAAVIACERPGKPIRVQWRREEEFGFEPVGPAMVVTARAALDDAGRPADWTTEIWSGRMRAGPGGGGNLLAAEALPDPPPPPRATESPDAAGGAGTRNGEPLYDFPAKRIVHHLIPETPVRTSSLRGLGANANVFAIESFDRRVGGARRRRPRGIPAVAAERRPRPRSRRARRTDQRLARRGCRRARATAAASGLPATRTAPPMRRSSPRSRSRKKSG